MLGRQRLATEGLADRATIRTGSQAPGVWVEQIEGYRTGENADILAWG
jgi:hypothetical protein